MSPFSLVTPGTLFLLVFVPLLLPPRAAPAEPIRLTMEDAVTRAAGATVEVSESRRDLSLAKANLARSRAILPDDPQVSAGAYHSTLQEDVFNDQGDLVEQRGYGPNYTFSISQEFEIAGQRALRMDAAGKDVERARFALKSQRDNLAATVKTAFIHALIEKEKLAVAQRAYDATAELATLPHGDRGSAVADRVEANLLRLQEAHARRELGQAKLSCRQALAALRRLCRLRVSQEIELVGSAEIHVRPIAGLDELLRRATSNRPDLAALQSAVQSADANLAAKHGEKIPNVTVSASVSQFAGATLAGGEISVPLPVFHAKAGDVEEAVAERNHSARELDLMTAAVEQDVSAAYEACVVAAEGMRAYQREIVPLNEENFRIQRRLYDRDAIAASEFIGAQVDYFSAQTEALSAVEEYNSQLIELQRVVAGDIAAVTAPDPAIP